MGGDAGAAGLSCDGWLAQFLGKPAWHLKRPEERVPALPEAPVFVDAKIPVARIADLARLQSAGFAMVDVNVQLLRPATLAAPMPVAGRARLAGPEDELAVRDVAGQVFVYDRFHVDPRVDHGAANALKSAWAGNYFNGSRGEWMVVGLHDGAVAGFLQLLAGAEDTVVIDLIGVAGTAQGQGLATAMIAHALTTCALGKAMRVGSQLANSPALALYQRLGFAISSADFVLHYHG